MRDLEAIERELDADATRDAGLAARGLLGLAEDILSAWVAAHGEEPTAQEREGFRLLALHHQGARGVPSFNACRETCREIAYRYNLLTLPDPGPDAARLLLMMRMLVRHLLLFVGGKLQVEGLGEFCCASKPLRARSESMAEGPSPL
jgi:hypothetical protein